MIKPSLSAALTSLALLAPATLAQYDSLNVSMHAQVSLGDVGQTAGNDCWGYVSPSGREYAIMGFQRATVFVDITAPASPVIVGNFAHASSTTGDIKVYQHYAYSVGDNYQMQIFDMSDIDNGNVALVRTIGVTSHNIALNTESGYLYPCASSVAWGIAALDLSDPTNPTVAGSWTPSGHVHDAQIVNYTQGPYAGKEIAFCLSGWDGMDILDVTDKANIVRLKHLVYPGLNYCHQGWLSDDRRYLYVSDELDEQNGDAATTRTLVFNVEDLANASFLGSFTTGWPSTDHNLYVKDGFIFEANYTGGLHIFDARTNQTNPTHVGYFDTYPENNNAGYGPGAWSSFPYYPSGTVIVSDVNRGLFILDPSAALGCDADFNGDGQVNTLDFLAYLNAFNAGDPAADINGDGSINTLDFLAYLNLFNDGC